MSEDWPVMEPGSQATPDDPVRCQLCGLETSVAMIFTHLTKEHGFDSEGLTTAPIFFEEDAPSKPVSKRMSTCEHRIPPGTFCRWGCDG